MSDGDRLYRFLFEDFPIRGQWVRLDATWQEAQSRRIDPPSLRRLLGDAMAASALLTAGLKFEGRLNLQIETDGPLRLVLAQCDHLLHLRATARYDEGLPSEEIDFGEHGRLLLALEGRKPHERYQGVVPLVGEDLAGALEHYFAQSEQLPARLRFASTAHTVTGLLLQRMPGESADPDAWNRCNHLFDTLGAAELQQWPAETLLRRLFAEENVRLFEPAPVSFRCRCSREGVAAMLRQLGSEELHDILREQGRIAVTCEFCGRDYRFDAVDVGQLLADDALPPSSATH
ncbi:MAG TPA: Hsp33 family molecular chaperone HslO [Candidatus Macondimonas sp.]|nr:Hsp33 family molecular chaperone HslO [Candidatus Macondimonas sp.]